MIRDPPFLAVSLMGRITGRPGRDPRNRNVRHHRTADRGPQTWDWASQTQQDVFFYGPAPMVASGGFNAAKTTGILRKILYISDLYPQNRGVIARRVAKELRDTTMASFYKHCPEEAYIYGGKRSDSEFYLRLNNGSEILFMHMDDPQTENVIRGLEINWFFLNQAEEIEEEIFDLLMMRLGRWDKTTVPEQTVKDYEATLGKPWPWVSEQGRILPPTFPMLDCNPDTEMHWIWRRFHPESPEHWEKRIPEPETGVLRSYFDLGYKLFHMSMLENKFVTKQQKQLALSKDEHYVRRFVHGYWGNPEGQIHRIPKESLIPGNQVTVDYLRRTCTLHRVLDHGDAAPTACGWYAVDYDGNMFFYREYYVPNVLISEHRKNITSLSTNERYRTNLADPSIFHPSMQKDGKRWSVQDEYEDVTNLPRETAIFWQKGDNDEMGTRNRINEYLRLQGTGKVLLDGTEGPRIHPITKEMGLWPRIFFITKTQEYSQGCDHIIRETRSQRRERIGTDNGRPIFSDDRDKKIPDHGYDLVRYAVASRPPLASEARRQYGRRSFHRTRMEAIRLRKFGAYREMSRRLRRTA